jgi:hypothetical protein
MLYNEGNLWTEVKEQEGFGWVEKEERKKIIPG